MPNSTVNISYSLPDKSVVVFSSLTASAVNELDNWLRSEYVKTAHESAKLLPDTVQKQFMLDVLDKAMTFSSQFGEGRMILLANVYGLTRYVWSHLSPYGSISFERFHTILFPDDYLSDIGVNVINEILHLLYPALDTQLSELSPVPELST